MRYKLTMCYSLPCETDVFTINDIEAEQYDFASSTTANDGEDYGCGTRTGYTKKPTQEILEKYKITEKEFTIIAEDLAGRLTFGPCGLCV